jgi:hypothetical protein
MNQSLMQTFNIDPADVTQKNIQKISQTITETKKKDTKKINDIIRDQLEKDVEFSKNEFSTLIDLGKDALQTAISKAELTEDPVWYSTIAALINSLTDATKQIIDTNVSLSKISKNIFVTELQPEQNPNFTIDKAIIFSGTTADLIAQLNPKTIENAPTD